MVQQIGYGCDVCRQAGRLDLAAVHKTLRGADILSLSQHWTA